MEEGQWRLPKLRCLHVKHTPAPSYLWQGKDDGGGASVCGLAPLEAVNAPRSVQPNRYVKEETTQVGGGKGSTVCLCKRPHDGERVTGQLSHNTLATAHAYNGTRPTTKKAAVPLPCHAGLCCKRSIAILSALRACESRSIANPERVKKVFVSLRNSIETVMVSVPFGCAETVFWDFRTKWACS